MAIEQLGESLLAQARSKRKKEEKKGKIFGGVLLGATVGNIYLRNRANKRADEFWKSNIGLLNQRANQFDMGVKWMTNHDKMLNTYGKSKDPITGENWISAFDSMKLKQYQTSPEYADLYKNDQQAFNSIVMPKLEDDREAYRQELEAYSDFKNIRSTDKATKTAYVSPLKNKLQKAVDLINKQSNVGGWAFSKIGITPSAELEDVALDKGVVKLPKGLDEKLKTDIVSSINTTMSNWNKIQNAVGVKDKFTDIELKSLMKKKKQFLPSIEPDREFKTIYGVASGIEENPNMKQQDFRVSFGKGEITVSKFLEEFEGSEGEKLTDTQIQNIYLDALKLADYNYKIYVKQKEELGVGALAIPEGGKKTFFDEALQNIIAGDFSYKVGGLFKDEPRGVYERQTINNLLNLITNKEDITIETSASGKDETISVDSNVVSNVISTEDAIKEKNNINRFTTPEEIINNFKTTVMANPQWSKSSPEIKSEVIKNILEDYPEMSEVLSNQFLDLMITDMKQRGKVDDTKVKDMKQRGEVDDTKVTTFGSILDKDFRKPFEEEKEKQERVPLLKVLGLDKESRRNRLIQNAEQFVDGKRFSFISPEFSKWLKSTKGLNITEVKKEDKPELVNEFLEFLKSN